MTTGQLFVIFRAPDDRANLRSSVNTIQKIARGSVPDPYVPILTTSSSGQCSRLPWTKGHCLDSGLVITEGVDWSRNVSVIPNVYQVIIGTGSQEMCVGFGRPSHSTDFLRMPFHGGNVVFSYSDIVQEKITSSGASGQYMTVPLH